MTTKIEVLTKTGYRKLTITDRHTGKMENMISISTSCLMCPSCQQLSATEGTVCYHCYAMRQLKRYKSQANALKENTEILTREIIPVYQWENLFNASLIRLEAFGDLINETQFENYLNICNGNRDIKFAIFTKKPKIVKSVLDRRPKPDNLQVVLSSPLINHPINDYEFLHNHYIDKVFTVYDRVTASKVGINCGKKHCFTCRKCYVKSTDIDFINEMLK